MQTPKIHECLTCGYVWSHGKHGGHSCSEVLLKKNERLLVLIGERELEIDKRQKILDRCELTFNMMQRESLGHKNPFNPDSLLCYKEILSLKKEQEID